MSRRATFIALSVVVASLLAVPPLARAGTPPTVTITTSSVLTASQRVDFDQAVQGVTTSNVVLRVAGTTSNLPASVACFAADATTVQDCATGSVYVVLLTPSTAMTAGQLYSVVVDPSGPEPPVVNATSDPAPQTMRGFRASTFEQEGSASGLFLWRPVSTSSAYGGSYRMTRMSGAQVSFTFTGTSVRWYTVRGPMMGTTAWSVDGGATGTYSDYATSMHYRHAHGWSGPAGTHTLTIAAQGSPSSHPYTSIDAFQEGSSSLQDGHYTWRPSTNSKASGGAYRSAYEPGARAVFRFRATGINWYTVTGPNQGLASVYIDGSHKGTFDNYASSTHYRARRTFTRLSDRVHTIAIVVLGKHRRGATASFVAVDAWSLRAALGVVRGFSAWVDLFDYSPSGGLPPAETTATMKARHVRTLFIETSRYNSSYAFGAGSTNYSSIIKQWVKAAHANGIYIVGWYFPGYGKYMSRDLARTAAIAKLGFDALGIDIESCTCPRGTDAEKKKFAYYISTNLRQVRSEVGAMYPIAAITPAPLGMALTNSWTYFPWSRIGSYADVEMPMAYWSYRRSDPSQCPGDAATYCAYGYTMKNIARAHELTRLPVNDIGGVWEYHLNGSWHTIPDQDMKDFVKGALAAKPLGAGFYDWASTRSRWWGTLEGLRNL